MNANAFYEALKEGGRLAVLAGVAALIAYLTQWLGMQDQTDLIVIVGTLVLRAADKYVNKNENINANGIVPF